MNSVRSRRVRLSKFWIGVRTCQIPDSHTWASCRRTVCCPGRGPCVYACSGIAGSRPLPPRRRRKLDTNTWQKSTQKRGTLRRISLEGHRPCSGVPCIGVRYNTWQKLHSLLVSRNAILLIVEAYQRHRLSSRTGTHSRLHSLHDHWITVFV